MSFRTPFASWMLRQDNMGYKGYYEECTKPLSLCKSSYWFDECDKLSREERFGVWSTQSCSCTQQLFVKSALPRSERFVARQMLDASIICLFGLLGTSSSTERQPGWVALSVLMVVARPRRTRSSRDTITSCGSRPHTKTGTQSIAHRRFRSIKCDSCTFSTTYIVLQIMFSFGTATFGGSQSGRNDRRVRAFGTGIVGKTVWKEIFEGSSGDDRTNADEFGA